MFKITPTLRQRHFSMTEALRIFSMNAVCLRTLHAVADSARGRGGARPPPLAA